MIWFSPRRHWPLIRRAAVSVTGQFVAITLMCLLLFVAYCSLWVYE